MAKGVEIASTGGDIDIDVDVAVVWLEFNEEIGAGSYASMRNDSSSRTVSLLVPLLKREPSIELRIAI